MSDRTIEVSGLMNHFWFTVLSEERFKKRSGLKYISHSWQNDPYWYLWFTDLCGVYKMELHDARTLDGFDWQADFIIKYYPSENESCYHGLSSLEKICRRSNIFHTQPADGYGCPCHAMDHDHKKFADLEKSTGVPALQNAEMMPSDFFYAGHLFIAFKDGAGSLLRVKSQTKWRVTITEDYAVADNEGDTIAVLKKGEVDRDYPGFEICDFLYRRFTGSWALFNQYSHHQERVWKGDGLNFFSDGQSLWPEPSPDIQKIIIQTALRCRSDDMLPLPADEDIACMD